jgi:hypothetical protein
MPSSVCEFGSAWADDLLPRPWQVGDVDVRIGERAEPLDLLVLGGESRARVRKSSSSPIVVFACARRCLSLIPDAPIFPQRSR